MQYNRQFIRQLLSGFAALSILATIAVASYSQPGNKPLNPNAGAGKASEVQSSSAPAVTASATNASSSGPAADGPPPYVKPLETVASNWLKRPELQHSLVGLEIMHIPSATVLFSHNGRRRFVPASTTKVFTTACAMDMLGAGYKYSTKLKIYGKVVGGVLQGSAYIEPSQDPTVSTEDLRTLLLLLKEKGIKQIDGKVDVVGIAGGGDRFSTSWLSEDWGQDWMPVPSDLVVDDNTARKDPARGYPLIPYGVGRDQNALVSSLLTSSLGPSWICFHPASKTMQFWHPAGPAVGGQIVGNPNEYNVAIANTIVKQMGIKVKGKEIPLSVMEETPVTLGEITTDSLAAIVKQCLKTSDNLYAQQLLRTLGTLPSVSKDVEKASLEERGIARINAWVTGMGVAPGDLVLWDGCGLSRKNCFTPHSLNMVHRHMAGAHLKSAYLDAMPLNGEPGSANGSWRYKTGSMDSVRTISGVLITGAGEPLALTIMVNAHSPSIRELRGSMSSLIDHLLNLPSLRLPNLPVKPIIIKPRGAAVKALTKTKRSSAAASKRSSGRGRRGHRR